MLVFPDGSVRSLCYLKRSHDSALTEEVVSEHNPHVVYLGITQRGNREYESQTVRRPTACVMWRTLELPEWVVTRRSECGAPRGTGNSAGNMVRRKKNLFWGSRGVHQDF